MSLLDNVDFDQVRDEVEGILRDSLDDLVDAAQEDLKAYGKAIAQQLVTAIKDQRDDLRRELMGQVRLLAEIHRIRLNREARNVLNRVLEVGLRIGKTMLTAAIAAV